MTLHSDNECFECEKLLFAHDFRSFQPLCLGGLVSYFAQTNNTDITFNRACWLASGLILSDILVIALCNWIILYFCKISYQIRVACSGLIYQKVLRTSRSLAQEGQTGTIINLLTSDLTKIFEAMLFIFDFWRGPLEAVVFFIIIYMEIGNAAFVGYAFLACFIPFNGIPFLIYQKLLTFQRFISNLIAFIH